MGTVVECRLKKILKKCGRQKGTIGLDKSALELYLDRRSREGWFVMIGVEAHKDVELLMDRLRGFEGSCVKAVVMFGSRARGESGERSDADLLVLHEGCGTEDPVERRRLFYNLLREAVGDDIEDITVIDMELERFLKPAEISALLLNIYWDAVVVYDATSTLRGFLGHVRERIMESGLRRVRDERAYRWVLPEPLKKVKIL